MIRVLIVDDHQLYREGIRAQFNAEPDMEVVGEAADARDSIDQAIACRPDIILMDINMPGLSAFDAIDRIENLVPAARVILCTGYVHDRHIRDAVEYKAWGFVLKQRGFEHLREAILAVYNGRVCYAPEVLERLAVDNGGRLRLADRPRTRIELLTPRERELLSLLAQGLSLKAAGRMMNVSYKTADKHKVSLMRKLDIHDRVELARFAIREKIIVP
ncbi:MAG: response regulator transcription factor [Phycisphaerae bacterium]|nr:response regulator transcription factor [Phycisphaerae bacterium]